MILLIAAVIGQSLKQGSYFSPRIFSKLHPVTVAINIGKILTCMTDQWMQAGIICKNYQILMTPCKSARLSALFQVGNKEIGKQAHGLDSQFSWIWAEVTARFGRGSRHNLVGWLELLPLASVLIRPTQDHASICCECQVVFTYRCKLPPHSSSQRS